MTRHTTPARPAVAVPDGLRGGTTLAEVTEADARLPVQLVALGRGRVVKTAFLNTLAQWFAPLNPGLNDHGPGSSR